MKIPECGMSARDVLSSMRALKQRDADWRGGRIWSLVYFGGDDLLELAKEAYTMFFSENALSPIAFPSLRTFESEVVAMTADLLGGGPDAAGTMTSGGTESIFLAVKAARDLARVERPSITVPEMILPVTAHPAFEKAAHYLNVKPVHIPLAEDLRADPDAARAAVTDNTVLMVGSAPAYPFGLIDPIPELAAIALERGIPFHVDSCIGGFLLPWLAQLGYDIPPFDLRVPGVTSISADLHKYGFSAKGASTVIYRTASLLRHQFFAYTDWPGGLYGSPSVLGTRPGGAIAAAWAVMKYLGAEGYKRIAARIMESATRLKRGIEAIDGLRILGKPPMSVFAFTSDSIDIYALAEAMEARGWHLDRQQLPPSLHLMVTPAHERVVDSFLHDLAASAEAVRRSGVGAVSAVGAVYGMVACLEDRGPARDLILDFLEGTLKIEG
jgi:sphinganine-1-phosphate aldolase